MFEKHPIKDIIHRAKNLVVRWEEMDESQRARWMRDHRTLVASGWVGGFNRRRRTYAERYHKHPLARVAGEVWRHYGHPDTHHRRGGHEDPIVMAESAILYHNEVE